MGNFSSRRQTLRSLPCFPRLQTLLIPPKLSEAMGTLPARRDERDGSEARSSLLTHVVSEALKPIHQIYVLGYHRGSAWGFVSIRRLCWYHSEDEHKLLRSLGALLC